MTYVYKRFAALIGRIGREAEVLTRGETGRNKFGNMTDQFTPDRTVLAYKTYPNRNTQIETRMGDRGQNNPVFIVPIGGSQPDPPAEEDAIRYAGTDYEVKAHTEYDTHVEFFGEEIIHDDSGE